MNDKDDEDRERPVPTAGAAKLSGLSPSYLNKARTSGNGPPYIKIGRKILYRPLDVRRWLASRVRISTSQQTDDERPSVR